MRETSPMPWDAPDAIREAITPTVEVPAYTITWHFVGGTSHTITAPVSAFDVPGAGEITISHNGVRTCVRLAQVLYTEARDTTIKRKKDATS